MTWTKAIPPWERWRQSTPCMLPSLSSFLQIGRYIPELVGCLANAQNIFDFLDKVKEPANWYRQDGAEDAMGSRGH